MVAAVASPRTVLGMNLRDCIPSQRPILDQIAQELLEHDAHAVETTGTAMAEFGSKV